MKYICNKCSKEIETIVPVVEIICRCGVLIKKREIKEKQRKAKLPSKKAI